MILLDCGPSPKGWHRLAKFMRCPRMYAISREMAKRGQEVIGSRDALVVGSMVHLAVAHHYARRGAIQPDGVVANGQLHTDPADFYAPHDALDVYAAKPGPNRDIAAKNLGMVHDIAREYSRQRAGETMKVVAVETVAWGRFADPADPTAKDAPLGTHRYDESGRFDLVLEDSKGTVFIMDTKTASRIDNQGDYYARDGQFLLYAHMGTQLWGPRFGGTILNLIQKAPYRNTRPNLAPVPGRMANFPRDVRYAEDRLAELEAQGLPAHQWPAVPTELTCQHRYGPCDVAELCDWGNG